MSSILIRRQLHLPGFLTKVYRTAAGIFVPAFDAFVPRHRNVLAVLVCPEGKLLIPGANIVTDAGDVHVAQRASGEAATNAFTTWEMCSAAATGHPAKTSNRSNLTVIAGSQQAQDAGYPRTNDTDTDNTGATTDTRTSRVSYTAASFNHAAITHGLITNATPGASEPLLTAFAFAASFAKTSSDTLKVFHNCRVDGI